jgi:hypothetical protein
VTIQTPSGRKRIKVAARMMTSKAFQAILTGSRPLPKSAMK